MSKPTLRLVLSAAAVILVVNLLLFNYSQFVILPLVGALFLLAVLTGLGDGLAALFKLPAPGILEKAALGLMAAAAYFTLAGFFMFLNQLTVLIFFAASAAVCLLRFLTGPGRHESRAGVKYFFARPLSEYGVFLVPLVYAALPPSFYDSLVYHLGIPNLYLQSGGFVATPQFVYANTFIYYEISLVPALFLGELVPRLFHFLLGTLFVLAAADEAVEHWGVRKKLPLILALVSLPMTLFLLVTCKNDLIGAIFIFLAIRQYRRDNWKWSAVFWGFAVGVKVFNLLPLALFLLLTTRPWKKADLKKSALVVLIVVLAVSPLLVKNLRFTGNPFFPFLSKTFPSADWDLNRFARLQEDVGRSVQTPLDVIRWPYALSFFNHGYGGLVGPLFLVFLPFLLLGPLREKKWLFWALLLLAGAPFLTASLRFVYIAFVVLAIFSLRAFEAAAGRLLKVVFYVLVAVNFVMGIAMLEKFYHFQSAWSGQFSPQQYREHYFPACAAFAYLNAKAPPRAKILLAGEARNFYLHRPYRLSSALDYCILNRYLAASRDGGEFFAAIGRDGFSYLLVNFFELQRLQEKYANMAVGGQEKLAAFLFGRTPVFSRGPVHVYEVPGPLSR
jgi:hypothetical protein